MMTLNTGGLSVGELEGHVAALHWGPTASTILTPQSALSFRPVPSQGVGGHDSY